MEIMSLFRLDGKNGLVTGAGQGLGKAIAIALAQAGANVVAVDLNKKMAFDVSEEIKSLGRNSLAVEANISKREDVEKIMKEMIKSLGRIDILVNNAGIKRSVPSEEMEDRDWREVINVNLTGTFFCCQLAAREMIRKRKGKIINVASMSAQIVNKGTAQASYYASKAGVVMLTRALAAEWAQYNINVNAISPGYCRTPLTQKFISDIKKYRERMAMVPLGRLGEPYEIGSAAVFLASGASDFITGHNLVVDGGYTLW